MRRLDPMKLDEIRAKDRAYKRELAADPAYLKALYAKRRAKYQADPKHRARVLAAVSLSQKQRRERDPDRFRAYHNEYQRRRLATDPLYAAKRRADNRKRMKEAYAKNPAVKDRTILNNHLRKARELHQLGQVSKRIRTQLMEAQGGKCAYCKGSLAKRKAHLDHIMPLVLGGLHDDSNLQMLCAPCNRSKHATHPVEFARSRGMLF